MCLSGEGEGEEEESESRMLSLGWEFEEISSLEMQLACAQAGP